MAAKSNDFFKVIAASNLLTPQQIRVVRELSSVDRSPRSVAKYIVQEGWLTRWQAQQLLAGRSKLFLGKYKLLDRLGEGGMGTVFKAEQPGLNRIVAVKVMSPEILKSAGAVERFLREIRSAAALSHPNIVAAYDADCVGKTYFLVMEYVNGDDLKAWLDQHGRMPIAWAAEVTRQVALGLDHAHQNGFVHRDIKPLNILIPRPAATKRDETLRHLPHAKLLDLGLAKFVSETQEEGGLTKTGQIMGTPDYIAPEQAQSTKDADIRADIFGLGCVCFQMLTGRLPFAGSGVMEKLMARTVNDAPRAGEFRPEVSPELEAILAKMLARNPSERYQTPGEVASELVGHSLGTLAEPEATIILEPEPRQNPGKVEAKADTTLNRFLSELGNQANGALPERESFRPQQPAAPEKPPAPWWNARSQLIQVSIGLFCMLLLLGFVWYLAGRNGNPEDKETPQDSEQTQVVRSKPDHPIKLNWATADPDKSEAMTTKSSLPNGWTFGEPQIVSGPGEMSFVSLSGDGLTAVYRRKGRGGSADLWEATRADAAEEFGNPQDLGSPINSTRQESGPCLSADGLELIFNRQTDSYDLYRCVRASITDPWGEPQRLELNRALKDQDATLSGDGLTLIFTSDRYGGQGEEDLWLSRRDKTENEFGPPENLGPVVNTASNERGPSLSADGLTVVFCSDREGGLGNFDLWASTRPHSEAPFGQPFHLGPVVNTPGYDNNPELSFDGRTLYYGRGDEGLYQAAIELPSTTLPNGWIIGPAVNLGPVVNSSNTDSTPFISADGLTLLFASSRPGGKGRYDIWMSTRSSVNDLFSEPVNIQSVNSEHEDSSPSLSGDGLTLVFHSTRANFSPDNQQGELWMSRRKNADKPFTLPEPITAINTHASVKGGEHAFATNPSLADDGLTLVFTVPNQGFFIATRSSSEAPFDAPELLVKRGTHGLDSCWLSPDGNLLVFTGKKPPEVLLQDLWMVVRDPQTSEFGEPVSLGPTVNSEKIERSLSIALDARLLVFDSDRPGSLGSLDLYAAPITIPPPKDRLQAGRWYDVLPMTYSFRGAGTNDIDGFSPQEPIRNATAEIAVDVEGSYLFHADFTRRSGDHSVNFNLPVGPNHLVVLYLDETDGHRSALHGADTRLLVQRSQGRLETGRRHDLDVEVKLDGPNATIEVKLDGAAWLSWSGSISLLAASHPNGRFSLGSYEGDTIFHEVHLKPLEGYARLTRSVPDWKTADMINWDVPDWLVEKQPVRTIGPQETIDLLALVDVNEDGLSGSWYWEQGQLVSPRGDPTKRTWFRKLAVPLLIEGGYTLHIRGSDAAPLTGVLTLPVAEKAVTLRLGAKDHQRGGRFSGLSGIDGRGIHDEENPTRVAHALGTRIVTLDISVTPNGDEASIAVRANGELLFAPWRGPLTSLKRDIMRRSGHIPPNCLALFPDNYNVWHIEKATLTMASGEAKLMREPPGPLTEGTQAGQTWDGNGLRMKFCWCPPGEFKMGNEQVQVDVALSKGFWMGQTEVTQAEWKAFMENEPWKGQQNVQEGANYPVTYVVWDEARQFCEKLTEQERAAGRLPAGWEYRLPTEAQWEYACRAGTETAYSFGENRDEVDQYLWHRGNTTAIGEPYAHPVALKLPNPWGLSDMHGNVMELCRDGYAKTLPGGTDPEIPWANFQAVVRGGHWRYAAANSHSAFRNPLAANHRTSTHGFRVALMHAVP